MKKLFVTFLFACATLSLVACGENASQEQGVEKVEEITTENSSDEADSTAEAEAEEVTKEEEVAEEAAKEEEETAGGEAVETKQENNEENYAELNNIPVINVTKDNCETFTFTEYNKNEDGTPDEEMYSTFKCPTTVNCEIVDNGDGTKTVTYITEYDIRDWSLEYYWYSSDTFFVDYKTGNIFSSAMKPNKITLNGETVIVDYKFEEEYDENYTKHTKWSSLTCPVEYEDYGFFISDTNHINRQDAYDNLDYVLTAGSYEKRVIFH